MAITLVAAIVLTGCIGGYNENGEETDAEGERQMDEVFLKAYYASNISLSSNSDPINEYLDYKGRGEVEKMELVFVHTAEEAEGYEEGVIVAWPSAKTERVLASLNRFIVRDDIDPVQFELEYPVTIEDIIDRWEAVDELLGAFSRNSRHIIQLGI